LRCTRPSIWHGFVVVLPKKVASSAAEMLGGKIVGEIVEDGIRVDGLEIS